MPGRFLSLTIQKQCCVKENEEDGYHIDVVGFWTVVLGTIVSALSLYVEQI
jgi:hypothetical protein